MFLRTMLYPPRYVDLFGAIPNSNIPRLVVLMVTSLLFTSSVILLIGIYKVVVPTFKAKPIKAHNTKINTYF